MPPLRTKTVQSVDRALTILRTLVESGEVLSVADLASLCDLERPTTWRLLWTLESNGLVERAEPNNGYRASLGWWGPSPAFAVDSLVRIARPFLASLAADLQVTASLALVERLRIVYVDQVDGPLFVSPKWEGHALSLHGSSPGKAVLAALSPAEQRGMLGASLASLTDTTITSMDVLERELETVRAQGYAVSRGEDVTYSNGASSVIHLSGRPVAAIDLWGPDRLVPIRRLAGLGRAAAGSAAQIEALLGGPQSSS